MTDSPIVLQAQGIHRHFEDVERRVDVLDGVDLTVRSKEMVAIVGASGSGKSTLLQCLGLLDRPDAGELVVAGHQTSGLNERGRSQIRNQCLGFVYQFHHLLPEFDAVDNVAMPLVVGKQPLAQAREQARALLSDMGLGHRLTNFPGQLSGGERQRVALARALVTRPVCVLADEPTGNLDRETALQVFEVITRIRDDFGMALVLVTHDLKLAQRADRCLSMVNGRLLPVQPHSDELSI
jgi:lipoprotein-releasing system ATP-binding protein